MISVRNVWKSYGGVHVLRGLSLDVPEGTISIILGKSGVGKSVLLRLICGLEFPDHGEISVHGIPYSKLTERQLRQQTKMVGMLFQSSALFDSMTVEENVGFALRNSPESTYDEPSIRKIVNRSLQQVGLAEFQEKYPNELSGGQKRRAALARMIAYRPSILLFDEPTTGLDPITARQIVHLIRQTQEELKSTVVIVTHDIANALDIGTHFFLHSEGKITVSGTRELFLQENHPLIIEFITSARGSLCV